MNPISDFIPGLTLSERFYWEAVRPILERAYPSLAHSAALLGPGSEVLGFDTVRSSDHHWGPRLILFLDPADLTCVGADLFERLRQALPVQFLGYSTHFSAPNPNDNGVRLPVILAHGPVDPLITLTSVGEFFQGELGVDPWGEWSAVDWLTFEEQRLLSLVRGKVFHDGLGQVEALRSKLAYYPHDLWLYLLAAEWQKIGQEEAFVGRTGEVGDEAGSRLVTGRLVQSLMRLGFMLERQYIPYSKWFGSAFARLGCAPRLLPPLQAALAAAGWHEREEALCQAYALIAAQHNALGITSPLATQPTPYFGRPFLVMHGEAIADQVRAAIGDESLRRLPPMGSVNQWVTSVDVLTGELRRKLKGVYVRDAQGATA